MAATLFAWAAFFQTLQSQEGSPPPFEKIYVASTDIFTTPEGIYYINFMGVGEKVRALRSDCYGTYVIKFLCQCPLCERYYSESVPPEGYDCPLMKKEIVPGLWCK